MVDTTLLRIGPPAGGMGLGLREKRPAVADPGRPPVLLAHGATLGGGLFDLPRAGYSLMEALARAGRAVYAVDVRGYGTSLDGLPDGPPEGQPPFARAKDVVPDLAAAVDFILERCGVSTVDLVGFSWGTITASLYAGAYPERVRRLVLYAPLFAEFNRLWLGRIADPREPTRLAPGLGAWRLVTGASLIERWNGDLPSGDPLRFREDGIAEQVFATMAALDSTSARRTPPSFRCPNGALADMVEVFNGHPLFDPGKLTMPLLIVRGGHDTTSSDTDCSNLLARVASTDARYCVIRGASHFLCIERRRDDLYDALDRFLEAA